MITMSNPKKKYDLIFSLGEACSCTQALGTSGLQLFSYPFDWLFGSSFMERCKILATRFARYIDKEDLEFSYEERSIRCQAYHNKYNDIIFNHDFPKDLSLDESYPQVREKYERRIRRLLSSIERSSCGLIVYIETPVTDHVILDWQEIIEGYNHIKDAFPGTSIDLLYVAREKESSDEYLTPNVRRIALDYKDYNSELGYVVNCERLKPIFDGYCLRVSLSYRLKKFALKVLVEMIPIRETRQKLRRKWHLIPYAE